jgi:hypothetical protein
MITIPEVVQQIVTREPYVEEGLQRGIINLSAYARSIRPQVEEILMKRVETGAILMALRRMETQVSTKSTLQTFFQTTPNIIIRSNLTEYTLENTQKVLNALTSLIQQNEHNHRHIVAVTQGVYETALIVSSEWNAEVRKLIPASAISDSVSQLSAITITLPPSNVGIPGIYYFILKALAWKDINVVDVVSTKNEFTILFDDREVDGAFTTIKSIFT